MVFGPWIEVFVWARSLAPNLRETKLRIPHIQFNFILIHYMYLISLTIIGSIILYPAKNLDYIDALFFASGAATQSGLNTVNVNDIHLYQQITLMLVACIANPIFINTFVVFVRLYWFEKRFQNVVLEAHKHRRTRERTRTASQAKDEHDRAGAVELEERGVGGRRITVLHPSGRTMAVAEHAERALADDKDREKYESETASSSTGVGTGTGAGTGVGGGDDGRSSADQITLAPPIESSPTQHRRAIAFADHLARPSQQQQQQQQRQSEGAAAVSSADLDNSQRAEILLASQLSPERHIAFVENQRNPKDQGTLYIPGPRDFDRGKLPQEISDEDEEEHETLKARPRRHSEGAQPRPAFGDARRGGAQAQPSGAADGAAPRWRTGKLFALGDAAHAFARAKNGVVSRLQDPKKGEDGLGEREPTSGRRGGVHDGDGEDDGEGRGTGAGAGAGMSTSLRRRGRARTFASFITTRDDEEGDPLPYLSYNVTIGRNSAFVNLTEEQREELGGIEYRALKTLAVVLVFYFVGFHLLGLVSLVPWAIRDRPYAELIESDGVSPAWWGIFTAASMFNDLGFTLTPDSMISFQRAVFPLLLGSYLIVIGNTGFPCMLRFVIWVLSKVVPRGSAIWEEYRFLLDHPRRCFTLLFPSRATWWLFWVLVLFNGLDLLFFIILDFGNSTVVDLPPGIRVLDGYFQAVSTRTAGFGVVNLADLHPGVQVSYLIMMYISVFPIAISVRRTNVYEEKSLGVWQPDAEEGDEDEQEDPTKVKTHSYVGNHLRRQLSFDLWFVFLGLFIIAIVEGGRIQNTNQYAFTTFSVLFEVVSAYGTVGLSLGYPGIDASFSAEFQTLSKLVIIAMQIRGRHRGLPYALDKAILLPSEEQQAREAQEGLRRMQRTATGLSTRSARSGVAGHEPLSHHTTAQTSGYGGGHMFRSATTVAADRDRDAAYGGDDGGRGRGAAGDEEEEDGDGQDFMPMVSRRATNLSTTTIERDRRRRNGLGKLLQGAFSAGPSKMD